MEAELVLVIEMVVVLTAATLLGYLMNRLRQPVLLGYLLGGMLVGPVLGWIHAESDVKSLAEVGVALLLFALGVEFSIKDLLKVRTIALGGGLLQIIFTILLGGGLVYLVVPEKTLPQAVFLGAVLSLSSTAVVLKSLTERNEVHTTHGQIMLAILIVQDLALGLMLAVLPALTQPPEVIGRSLFQAVLTTVLFGVVAIPVGIWLIPWLMRHLARTGSQELFLLGVLVLCLGIALLTDKIGLGIEMGAFVAGLMVSSVESADHALDRVLPMRDVFATVFFASIGLLIDPVFLWANGWFLLLLVAIVMVGKAVIVTVIVRLFGYSLKTALTVGNGINQIGEFSFVLAGVARGLGVFSQEWYGLTVGTTAITLLATPFWLKLTPHLFTVSERLPVIGPMMRASQAPRYVEVEEGISDHIVVAGYGRVGRTLVRILRSQGHKVLVIDNDEATLPSLRQKQISYLYGDASSELVLEKAHLPSAKAMAIALPDPLATRLTLKRAMSLAPSLDITVRAHVNQEIDTLYQLGANEVVQPEFEASLEMGAHMLLQLGTSAYQAQQIVNDYRSGRYREIIPEQSEDAVAADLQAVLGGLGGQWYTLPDESFLAGRTLAQADIRGLTGATVMVIKRLNRLYRYPDAEMILEGGDRLLVVGDAKERTAFEQLLKRKEGGREEG
jgi:monovalent cation:H+ antiporter-2, CPA2 family